MHYYFHHYSTEHMEFIDSFYRQHMPLTKVFYITIDLGQNTRTDAKFAKVLRRVEKLRGNIRK